MRREAPNNGGLVITGVEEESIGASLPISPGDRVIGTVNDSIRDYIDYKLAIAGENIELLIERPDGERLILDIEKEYDEDLGLRFAELFPQLRRCQNRCLFCFLDQMPSGLRETLYFNDDDYRLSFWDGNFTTLTNLRSDDVQRIREQHLSPLYISVHTTNPELREQMLRHPRARQIMEQLTFLSNAGIEMHTQVVLCPGINDGSELDRTITDLSTLWPAVRSIAVVPVGLTKYREHLHSLSVLTENGAVELLAQVQRWQRVFTENLGDPLVYPSDEVYLRAGVAVPESAFYGEFPQLENGIGLVRRYLDSTEGALHRITKPVPPGKTITVVSGTLAAKTVSEALKPLETLGLKVDVVPVANRFFGSTVTVTGLLTGRDIIEALSTDNRGDLVVIPRVVFNDYGVTLDDMSVVEVERILDVPITTSSDPAHWIEALIGTPYSGSSAGGAPKEDPQH